MNAKIPGLGSWIGTAAGAALLGCGLAVKLEYPWQHAYGFEVNMPAVVHYQIGGCAVLLLCLAIGTAQLANGSLSAAVACLRACVVATIVLALALVYMWFATSLDASLAVRVDVPRAIEAARASANDALNGGALLDLVAVVVVAVCSRHAARIVRGAATL